MSRILRTAQSRRDYDEIWDYIAEDNPNAADDTVRLFDRHLLTLAASPGIGKMRAELSVNLRSFPVGNYLIFYRPIDDGIQLIRVIHGARDIDSTHFE